MHLQIYYILPEDAIYQKFLSFFPTALSFKTDFILCFSYKNPDNRKIKGPQSTVDAFKKLAKKVDEEDNPIIMIMELKE